MVQLILYSIYFNLLCPNIVSLSNQNKCPLKVNPILQLISVIFEILISLCG